MSKQITAIKTFSLLLAAVLTGSVTAQGKSQLEEVIVTAQKREQSLQDVPIAVVAVSGSVLRATGVAGLEELSASIPNLHVHSSFAQGYVSIRGMSSGINPGFESTVGLVLDGYFYPRDRFSRLSFLDVERVEVLKGPQGALIGKNTTAGAINIVSQNPTDEFSGWGQITGEVEGDTGYTAQGALSGPIFDTFKGRVAVRYDDHDGFLENQYTGKDNPQRKEFYIRGTLLWEPMDDLSFTGSYSHVDLEHHGRNHELLSCDQSFINRLVAANQKQFEDCTFNFENSENFERPGLGPGQFDLQDTEANIATLTINYETPWGTLTSLTGYSDFSFFGLNSGLRTVLLARAIDLGEDYDQISEEVRLTSRSGDVFDYILGAYYLNANQQTFTGFNLFPPANLSVPIYADQDSETLAGFGQLVWHITDTFDLTVEGRYTREEKTIHMFANNTALYQYNQINFNLYNLNLGRTEYNFSPGVNLVWSPNDDMMFYASYREGFKSGGYNHFLNAPNNTLARALAEFDEEGSESYELGTKLKLAGGAAELNITYFHTEYTDLQVTSNIPIGALAAFKVTNAAAATSQGVEIEGRWQASDRLLLGARAAYLDAKYDSFRNSQCYTGQTAAQGCIAGVQDQSGNQLPFAPEWSGAADGTYIWPLDNGWELVAYGEAVFNDDQWVEFVADPIQRLESHVKVNGRLALRVNNWELSIIGRNLTNEKTFSGANQINFSTGGTGFGIIDPPRSISLQLFYQFGQ